MYSKFIEALRRLPRAAEKAVRRGVVWAPLVAALLGGASPAGATGKSSLYINVTIVQGIGNITNLAAVPATSTGAISLSWTEPYHSIGTAPYSYDVRVSTVGQIANETVFSTSPALSFFSPSVPPAPGAGGGAAGFVVANLTQGVTYYFGIQEKDSTTLHGSWSRSLAPPINVSNFSLPASPTSAPSGGTVVAVYGSSITASWGVSAGATDYTLVASSRAVNPPASIAGSSTTASSAATVSGLGANTTYFLFVSACGLGCSSYDALGATVTLASPAASLSAGAVSSSTVALAWLPNGNPSGTTYVIEVSTDGVDYSSASASVTTGTVVGGLASASTYYFEVVAQNFAGIAAATSNAVQVITPSGPPAGPVGGGFLSVTVSSITADWTPSAGATDYVLIASTSQVLPPTLIAGSSTTASSTGTVSGLALNASYYFFLAACGNGCSSFAALGSTYTLAAPAVSLSSTSISSATISLAWSANGDPLGTSFLIEQSTDGVSFAAVLTSTVPAAEILNLTGGGTYYFEAIAVNGSGVQAAPSNVLRVVTPSGPAPSTPTGLTANAGLLSVSLTWTALPTAQQGLGLAEYRLLRSTNSGFGFVQIATTTGASYLDQVLSAGVTEYYELVARDIGGTDSAPSAAVSAVPFTELPMEPLGLTVVPASTTVTISWSPTSRFYSGAPFLTTGTPNGDELKGYSLFRSTNICSPSFTQVASLPIASTTVTDFSNGMNYYYRVLSYNSLGYSSNPVTLSSLGQVNYFVDDCVTSLVLDQATASSLNGATNGMGDIRIMSQLRPQDVGNGIYQSAQWNAYLNGVSPLLNYTLPKASRYVIGFSELNGVPVPSTGATNGVVTQSASAAGAASVDDLGVFWNNGQQFVKMYGTIDPVGQTLSVTTPNMGVFQIRAQARSAGVVFDVSNIPTKVITPNGDGNNDTWQFVYDPGPENVTPTGKVFDLRGAFVADMVQTITTGPTLMWNGYMNGLPVHSGVYVYRITGGGKTFTGTIVVAR